MVFRGLGIAALYKILMRSSACGRRPRLPMARDSAFPRATAVDCNATPEYLGVGYIIGCSKIAGVPVAGGILSQLVLVP
ncbi:MAG: hypothetical protein R2862_04245 [Thermoanaerobaculia bacterium]